MNADKHGFSRLFTAVVHNFSLLPACVGGILAMMGAKFWNRLSHECELWRHGSQTVAGVDEAGCGPLAGPVVAAAVAFPRAWLESGLYSKLRGLNDSKQLSEEQREKFYSIITGHPEIQHAISVVDVEMIDQINIRQAAWRAMNLALDRLQPRAEHVLVDGLKIRWLPYPQTALVQGDCKSYSIAAASVLAKVTRDRLMREYDVQYPGYGFAEHKGYATPQHYAAITERGPCPIHRRSFAPFRPVETELELFAETADQAALNALSASEPIAGAGARSEQPV
jgi:ribonuclease HII